MGLPERQGLYDPRNEHNSCGIGFVANIKGPISLSCGLQILVNLDHRSAVGADTLSATGRLFRTDAGRAVARLGGQARADPSRAWPLRGRHVLSPVGGRLTDYIFSMTDDGQPFQAAAFSSSDGFLAVPEPATWAMLLPGLAAAGIVRRRRLQPR
jgi:hypothetical protein